MRGGWTYVHDAGVDVAKLLEAKEPGGVGGVIEDVGLGRSAAGPSEGPWITHGGTHGGGIDGDGPRVGGRVGFLPARALAYPPKPSAPELVDRDGPG